MPARKATSRRVQGRQRAPGISFYISPLAIGGCARQSCRPPRSREIVTILVDRLRFGQSHQQSHLRANRRLAVQPSSKNTGLVREFALAPWSRNCDSYISLPPVPWRRLIAMPRVNECGRTETSAACDDKKG